MITSSLWGPVMRIILKKSLVQTTSCQVTSWLSCLTQPPKIQTNRHSHCQLNNYLHRMSKSRPPNHGYNFVTPWSEVRSVHHKNWHRAGQAVGAISAFRYLWLWTFKLFIFTIPKILLWTQKHTVSPDLPQCCLNCMTFDQLIIREMSKIVATRCQILRLKCTKFDFGWGSLRRPPDLLAAMPYF